jgi:geranylgeranyl diphosphate synthase, type II
VLGELTRSGGVPKSNSARDRRSDAPAGGGDAPDRSSEAPANGGETRNRGSDQPLAVRSPYPQSLRAVVERHLRSLRFSEEALTAGLEEAMRYSLLAPAKRIRPVLALATARAIGLEQREVLPLAGAIELIHTYSLIHDDLPAMDDDELRRGQPTCHVMFGEDVAILAGDGLYAEAFRQLLSSRCSAPERVLAAAGELAAATGLNGMVGGQYADVNPRTPAGPEALRRLHELKTGRLIAASVVCVLLLGGLDGPATISFRRFATELGVLFQIVDDILDVTGTDAALGKPHGSDERHGKRTYVSEFGLVRAGELAARSHATAREALAEAGDRAGRPQATAELAQIADFIYTRTS